MELQVMLTEALGALDTTELRTVYQVADRIGLEPAHFGGLQQAMDGLVGAGLAGTKVPDGSAVPVFWRFAWKPEAEPPVVDAALMTTIMCSGVGNRWSSLDYIVSIAGRLFGDDPIRLVASLVRLTESGGLVYDPQAPADDYGRDVGGPAWRVAQQLA